MTLSHSIISDLGLKKQEPIEDPLDINSYSYENIEISKGLDNSNQQLDDCDNFITQNHETENCIYEEVGCHFCGKPSDMAKHMKDFQNYHLNLTGALAGDTFQNLKTGMKNVNYAEQRNKNDIYIEFIKKDAYRCNKCGKAFRLMNNLKLHSCNNIHLRSKNKIVKKIAVGDIPELNLSKSKSSYLGKKYKCHQCSKLFSKSSTLKIHECQVPKLNQPKSNISYLAKKYKCVKCSKQLKTLKNHECHKNNVPTKSSFNSYLATLSTCKVCGITFKNEEHFKKHVSDVHFCHLCFKYFSQKDEIEQHKCSYTQKGYQQEFS